MSFFQRARAASQSAPASSKSSKLGDLNGNVNRTAGETRRRVKAGSILAACVSAAVLLTWLSTPSTRASGAGSVTEPLCSQVPPLYPHAQRELWDGLSSTFASPSFVDRAAHLLGGAVRVPTEVYDEMGPIGKDTRWEVFSDLHDYLRVAFPRVHASLELTKVNTYGLVYVWKGSDVSLKPLLLTAHQDVVPVNAETYDQWEHPPFSGYYDGTYVWGRGSADDKSGLIGILTSVELLLERGFQPRREITLAFGFDEEASGKEGGYEIGAYLLAAYGKDAFAMLVDEGGEIEELYGGVFALPAVAEKGYLDVRVDVAAPGGHSSVPPAHTTIGMLAQLLVQYENHPPKVRLSRASPMYQHAQCLAAHAPGLSSSLREVIKKSATSDEALALAEKQLFQDPVFKALVSTTQAVDMVGGGVKSNALPENAMAIINHRIATDSSVAAVQEHSTAILRPLAAAFNLSFTSFGSSLTSEVPASGTLTLSDAWDSALEPAPITPTGEDSMAFKLLSGSIKATYESHRFLSGSEDSIVVIPSLGAGNTDTQFYWSLTPHIFRYTHYVTGPGSGSDKAHTVNEACKADSLVEMARFFSTLILNVDEGAL
ncbi:uncharacterized protein FIBRA_06973 [Fibroporia radiculosa]|uniref:Peptidase M20 dimerisation domain-containing protein n=1 Tax=Fibroporia radiculosa TaxID=599839 RepID=J4HZY2_9APHY|nr:uncharacterized protein FIBRA_06973 [Fibroporia radiculosa]CCM04782.1 predicted protein [Fibroporia radiculosa]